MIGIKAIEYVLASRVESNLNPSSDQGFDFGEEFIRDKIGIHERRLAAEDESTGQLAREAAKKLIAESDLAADDVELLIVVTQTPDRLIPHVSAILQAEAGLPKSILAFDVSLGCSGYVLGLVVAESLMKTLGLKNGILVTAETYSRLIAPSDRATAPIFGDGAAATWLSSDAPLYTLGQPTFGTDGSSADALTAKGSGTAIEEQLPLFMDGRGIFNFVMTTVGRDIRANLEQANCAPEEVDFWVFHQASRFVIESLSKALGIPAEKVILDIEKIGNTTSSTIPIALKRNILGRDVLPERVFMSGFGVGLSWGSCLLHKA